MKIQGVEVVLPEGSFFDFAVQCVAAFDAAAADLGRSTIEALSLEHEPVTQPAGQTFD